MEDRFGLQATDPEFAERMEAFALNEVVNEPGMELDDKTRNIAIMASLMGCQAIDLYKVVLEKALDGAVTQVEAKEIVYQACDYLGFGKAYPFIQATNEVMKNKGIALPLEGQATTTMEDRLEKGVQAQVSIFGPAMSEAYKASHINRWLAANCFGDYYTRTGLDLKQREMVTFCFLLAQGGCEPQLTSHAMGNIALGNDKLFLMKVVSQCIPYVGYPRTLNAVTCINNAWEQMEKMIQKK
ncbi:carboxymuconolactone decarboxylase family protein [Terrisporobacter vanillatitrophus]|uniref:carboxymuconolactone decarboxylase family protein n=1 Tax=Terrisporobacter vanillatitrophus TaxID=3058402 RepID=UPI003367C43F